MSKMDLPVVIGVVLMIVVWIGAMFNIGDITHSLARIFHWIESLR
ncbi:Uncharacterised protein [Serratia quinivorans]|nr:Uncharacterised protein [Serratia quinivorans]CAI0809237.1 Uncharacterised protein [Serratia quinivorans]CAI0832712.1 Uncharacterised protein [Serratia quinivorans]CAI0904707.1 Uncharacterised protein [Serratia quinivorans]CAI1538629.1 Uncharacterised protein [Serratia quinivorans]